MRVVGSRLALAGAMGAQAARHVSALRVFRTRLRDGFTFVAGQIAPKMSVGAVRWSWGAEGLVPRRAQRRAILSFWPTLASSASQTSTPSRPTPCARPIASRRAESLF